MRRYDRSKALYDRALKVLAGGVSSEFRKFNQPHPLFYTHAHGSRVFDADENEYLDFTLSQGPLILGHSHPEVLNAVEVASRDGQLFAGQHLQELELAELLQRVVPSAELVRFSLSGSEAVHAALRVARAVSGRHKFIRFEGHYHGWLDSVSYGVNGSSLDALGDREHPTAVPWTAGLPEHGSDEMIVLPWNDLALLERTVSAHRHELAAILTEGVMCNSGCVPPAPGFLEGVRALCDQYDLAFILDEVITGFRLGMGGAQAHFKVTPDLSIFAKAMANGYPISALVGRRRWMAPIAEGLVIHAGTLNSANPTVAAALTTLRVLERDRVHERLFAYGHRLMAGIRQAARETGHSDCLVQGFGPMFHVGFTALPEVHDYRDVLSYDKAKYAAFVGGMQERGIRLIGRGLWYLSAAHTEAEVEQAIEAARETFGDLATKDTK